ncbi:MAG: DUF305 domain-containing protein [Candidatus Paceibacterota bacterium]
MENKNQTIIIGLLALIIGLLLGYFFGMNNMPHRESLSNEPMHEEMEERMYGDEVIDGDGAMIHAMDEMMLGFRGKTGEEYEEAFLRGMIVHHFGAVHMAEGLLEQTERPELRAFAQDIIDVQSEEIETMKGWLEDWFNNKN